MSDVFALGDSDADARWIGVRRHQAALAIVGLGLVGDWISRSNGRLFELVFGALLVGGAAPVGFGLTGGEWVVILGRFVTRSRWSQVATSVRGDDVRIVVGGEVVVRGYELDHRGRLDLSGRDLECADALDSLVKALAASSRTQHVSLHVHARSLGVSTLMALPTDVHQPDGWALNSDLLLDVVGTRGAKGPTWLLERWWYVRTRAGVVVVLRVRDFSAVPEGLALLERVQRGPVALDVALHLDVVTNSRAQRIAARAVHRLGSDQAVSGAVGFRRTARTARVLERTRQREVAIAGGASLLRIGVYLVVRASTLGDLRSARRSVVAHAHEAGLHLERGFGRQSQWFVNQLPGGLGW